MKSIYSSHLASQDTDHHCELASPQQAETPRQLHYKRQYQIVHRMRRAREAQEIVETGLLDGTIQAVVRPDGQIGYALTDTGRYALRCDEGE
jgi:hypothetical protein